MRRYVRLIMVTALAGWAGGGLLFGHLALADPAADAGASPLPAGRFDRAALQRELSQPLEVLEQEPTEALRAHVQQLGDLHYALELAVDVSPEEQRALSERILNRVGQVGLLIRQRLAESRPSVKGRALVVPAPGPLPRTDVGGVLLDNAGLLVRVLGGLLIAFALGYLVRERRATLATGAVAKTGRRKETLLPVRVASEMPTEGRPMTLEEIWMTLESGQTVLLQMGYEVASSCRARFLELAREAQQILSRVEGQTYTVWEDPDHPNRFYELLVCRRLEVLNQLASADGPLSKLGEEIDACRVPSGFSLHRAWLGALPDEPGAPRIAAGAEDWLAR